jgi:hypothetical protein
MNDLKDQLHLLMEAGVKPLSAADVARRPAGSRSLIPAARRWRPVRLAAIGAGTAAVACAGALIAAQSGGSHAPASAAGSHGARPPATLTAAYIRHLASASRLALAHSGEAVISSRQTLQGTLQQSSKDTISFDGGNWSDSFSEHFPALGGQAASTQSAINRVVNGQAYDYFVAADGLAWYHDTGPNAVRSMRIPDPRKLLNELAPGAGFVRVAAGQLNGVPVEQLRATTVGGLPQVQLPGQWNIGRLTALDVWVDGQGVVRKLTMTASQTLHPGMMSLSQLRKLPKSITVTGWKYVEQSPIKWARAVMRATAKGDGKHITIELEPGSVTPKTQLTTITVSFLGIGQHQVIRVPAHAIPTSGLG